MNWRQFTSYFQLVDTKIRRNSRLLISGFVFFSSTQVVEARIEECTGLALVRPENGVYGTIYMDSRTYTPPLPKRPRAGYLPSGVVVSVQEPPIAAGGEKFKKDYCVFTYRDAVNGYVSRNDVVSITKIIVAAGVEVSKIQGFVTPANPSMDSRLKLYKTRDLKPDDVIAELGRNDVAAIFLMSADQEIEEGPIQVKYVSNPDAKKPTTVDAYIKAEEDRSSNRDGTYRIYKPILIKRKTGINRDNAKEIDIWEHIKRYAAAILNPNNININEMLEKKRKQLINLDQCDAEYSISLDASLKAGLEVTTPLISVDSKGGGKAEVTWKKQIGKVQQFTKKGEREDISLTIRGIAECKDLKPVALTQAHIIVGNITDTNTPYFTVDREEFFVKLKENKLLSDQNLELKSRNVNIVNSFRPVSQILIVPYNAPASTFYYTLFDQIERYMSEDIFDKMESKIAKDDEFAVILLIVETFAYWSKRS